MARFKNKRGRKPAGGGNQLATKPAQVPGGIVQSKKAGKGSPPQVPGWQQAGFDSRREAAQAAKAAGHEGSLRSFVQSQFGGGGGGPQLGGAGLMGRHFIAEKPYGTGFAEQLGQLQTAQKPGGEGGAGLGSFAPGNMPKFPGFQPPPDVSGVNLPPGYKKIDNGIYDPSGALVYGSGGSFVDPEGGMATRDLRTINELPEALGGGNQLATKPAQLPQWVRDRGASVEQALQAARKVPSGTLAQALGRSQPGGGSAAAEVRPGPGSGGNQLATKPAYRPPLPAVQPPQTTTTMPAPAPPQLSAPMGPVPAPLTPPETVDPAPAPPPDMDFLTGGGLMAPPSFGQFNRPGVQAILQRIMAGGGNVRPIAAAMGGGRPAY